MIRRHDEPGGKSFDPKAIFRSMEKERSKTEPHDDDKAYQAQQLVYDAWEATSDAREAQLMAQALELNPRNVDALLYTLDIAGLEPEEEIQALRQIVASGEQDLADKFKESTGHFWGVIETRPYMRARQRLAESLNGAKPCLC